MIKALGFEFVAEVSFGADLVADRYKKLVSEEKKFYISSDCPSIVNLCKILSPCTGG
jgi:iron only hydrogenase large subunit-like protein